MTQQKSAQIKNNNSINKINKNSNYNNIQFENKKNQFLSRIKKDHSIAFKKRESFNNFHISKIYPIKNKENKNINYIKYNKSDSMNRNENSFIEDNNNEMDYCKNKKINTFTSCYNHNNYDSKYDIYHLNKSKNSLINGYSNNGSFVFNKNYIGMKNLKYNYYSNDNSKYQKRIDNKMDIDALSSDDSSIEKLNK